MKGFISIATVCFLVCVQVSAGFPENFEQEINSMEAEQLLPWEDSDEYADVSDTVSSENDADDITADLDLLEVALKMGTIDDLLLFHQNVKSLFSFKCWNNTCQICCTFICLKITYVLPARKLFQICAMYRSIPIYCKTISAQDFRICMRVPFVSMKSLCGFLEHEDQQWPSLSRSATNGRNVHLYVQKHLRGNTLSRVADVTIRLCKAVKMHCFKRSSAVY
ncbi:hypothetical protein ACJMK2_043830 [Sinanodonta woodiana]|uniref:Uncharacterized protein n=1 Tax=Sinanodonta woodiana TaxID=1069815 RepID=A0ABD3VY40_SINWO